MYASKGYTKEVELLFGEVNMVVKGFGFLEYFDFHFHPHLVKQTTCHSTISLRTISWNYQSPQHLISERHLIKYTASTINAPTFHININHGITKIQIPIQPHLSCHTVHHFPIHNITPHTRQGLVHYWKSKNHHGEHPFVSSFCTLTKLNGTVPNQQTWDLMIKFHITVLLGESSGAVMKLCIQSEDFWSIGTVHQWIGDNERCVCFFQHWRVVAWV